MNVPSRPGQQSTVLSSRTQQT